ncbi:hypothetical protein G6F55_012132 [Rhizopus delemar]|uniref:Reverse transcriptase zinc-binding domain-containing protein n=2 Tax=Rhizopus TaxID=4842 RepID=A0A9P6XXK6_RHIOR|nr:hypothetical protein G6F55_012132 [Rhizopus delemar]KAG1488897.1 hypothetical protein G6F54_011821 [Rhizopus delemar]KAG1534408.1 hypothetical protein G6F51_012114 [Rhizopus arrhizus]
MFLRISMATLCLPRTLGGLGVLDLVTQQSALQLRWILPLPSPSPPGISSDDDSSIALSQSIVLPSLIQYLLFHLDQWVKRPRMVYSFDFSKFDLRLCFLFVDLRPPVLRVHDGVFSLLFRCMDLLPKDFSDTVINHETSLQLPISASIQPDCIQLLSKTQTRLPCSTAYKFDPASRRLKPKLTADMDFHPTLTKRFLRLVRQNQVRLASFFVRSCIPPMYAAKGPHPFTPALHNDIDASPFLQALNLIQDASTMLLTTKSYRRACVSPQVSAHRLTPSQWSHFWKFPLSHHCRNVWFRLIHGKLPYRSLLHRIMPAAFPDACCPICRENEDTLEHFLYQCPVKLAV